MLVLGVVCRVQTIDLCTTTADSTYFTVSFDLHPADQTAGTTGGPGATPGTVDMETEGSSQLPTHPSVASSGASPGVSTEQTAGGTPRGCYGVALWFDTDFSPRFCKETPVVLSTTPWGPPTHWQQVLLTFRTPIFLAPGTPQADPSPLQAPTAPATGAGLWRTASGPLGTPQQPAQSMHCRLSVGPGLKHRSLDFSIEVAAVGANGHRKGFPAQIFTI